MELEINEIYEGFQGNFSKDEIYETYSMENINAVLNDILINKLRLNDLNEDEKNYIVKFVISNKDRFFRGGQKLEAASTVMHRAPRIDDIPINVKQYKIPISPKEEVEKQVQEMLDTGIIKSSSSPYNSHLWIVPKKMDSAGKQKWRLVSDFRQLNDKTISDGYPLPDITQITDQVGGHKYYTTLDLAKGFQQILMDLRDAHKTAFSTPHGNHEYLRMTFEFKNAPPPHVPTIY